jgi:stromal membrane-associated protein
MSTRHERQANKSQNDANHKTLKELSGRIENRKCADCKAKDPRWASTNLGIFICMRCAGVHRSLGTHISKVRSIDLDTWTTEHVDNMVRWGNAKANAYWEGKHPDGVQPGSTNVEFW